MHAQHVSCRPPICVAAEWSIKLSRLQACVGLLVQPVPFLASTAAAGDEHVAQSPYPLRVLPARPAAKRCAVEGSGRSAAVAVRPAEFVVEVCDEYGNRWAGWKAKEMLWEKGSGGGICGGCRGVPGRRCHWEQREKTCCAAAAGMCRDCCWWLPTTNPPPLLPSKPPPLLPPNPPGGLARLNSCSACCLWRRP